jgi:hypothetical protein
MKGCFIVALVEEFEKPSDLGEKVRFSVGLNRGFTFLT